MTRPYAPGDLVDPVERPLTGRQLDVLRAYAKAGDRREAARSLGMKLDTLKNHLTDAYLRLGAESALHAFRILGWLQVPG
jgi:DNA-binding CsgD family transcriptional regulator